MKWGWRKFVSSAVAISHLMLIMTPTVQAAQKANSCFLKASVCVDGPSTKTINGVEVRKECWEYKDQYECLEKDPADFCAPLKNTAAQCEVQGQKCLETQNGECLRYTHQYSCDIDLKTLHGGRLPEQVEELEHTHLITSNWDETSCKAKGEHCKVVSSECLEPNATKIINGVPVTKDCWKEQRTMQCTNGNNSNQCAKYEQDASCTMTDSKCVHTLPDGSCQIQEKQFSCTESAATTKEVSSCEDRDFTSAMTKMEMAREMQRFYDPSAQRFFNGEANKCSIKLGGALDGVLGGDCCQTEADPASMKDSAVRVGAQMAAQYALKHIASHYTYTTLTGQAASYFATALSAAGVSSTTAAGATAATNGIGAFGFSVAPSASGGLVVGFDPVSFGIAIAIMALQQWLKCDQAEILTAMKRKADLCHYVGSYCGKKAFGGCVTKMESQCCYVSKLAKIINVGGKAQLKRSFGTPENPSCEGFTAQDLETLDFSKLDLSEFYNEIYAEMSNINVQTGNAAAAARKNIEKGTNARVKNYYEFEQIR